LKARRHVAVRRPVALIGRSRLRSGPNGGKYMIFQSLRKSFGGKNTPFERSVIIDVAIHDGNILRT
jgi:hypothetical protein